MLVPVETDAKMQQDQQMSVNYKVTYYRKFIKDFAKIAKCLHVLTGKETKCKRTDKCNHAFHILKEKLVRAPIL